MEYRKLGKTGLEVSAVGLGMEHLIEQDEKTVVETVAAAVAAGVNYFDCITLKDDLFPKFRRAFEGIRSGLCLTYVAMAELPAEETAARFSRFLEETGFGYVDIFYIGCCDRVTEYDRVTGENSLLTLVSSLKSRGLVRHIGLSTHVTSVARRALESGEFGVVMLPVNPAFDMVENEEAIGVDVGNLWEEAYGCKSGTAAARLQRKDLLAECWKQNVGVVVMKPFAAGWLFRPDINTGFTPINLLEYALSRTGVSTVIPGCKSVEELNSALRYFEASAKEKDFTAAVGASRWSATGHCMFCTHCMPCPNGIDIAALNRLYDRVVASGNSAALSEEYDALSAKASACVRCGVCEKRCPFAVQIMRRMQETARRFER